MARRGKQSKQLKADNAGEAGFKQPSEAFDPKEGGAELNDELDVVVLPPGDELDAPLPVEDELLGLPGDASSAEPDSRSIVTYDPLQAYLRDIAQYPILSREDERALAIKFKEQGDLDAAYRLVLSNLKLVVMIAREYQRAARNLLDLIQEGNIGLMEAVKNFDPYRNVRFPSYAVWWIKAYIVRFLIANWRLVKLGTTQAQRKLFFNLQKEKEKLEREGFYPAPKLLAERLDVKESDIIEMEQRLGAPDVSVDAPLNDEEGEASLLSIMSDGAASAEQNLARKEMQTLLHNALNEFREQLDRRERAIFDRRMLAESKATLEEIASEFNLSRERIRQLEVRIESKLKQFLKEHLGAEVSLGDLEG